MLIGMSTGGASRVFWDLGIMAFFSGSWGALVLYVYFQGFVQQAYSFWDLGSPAKQYKKSHN